MLMWMKISKLKLKAMMFSILKLKEIMLTITHLMYTKIDLPIFKISQVLKMY